MTGSETLRFRDVSLERSETSSVQAAMIGRHWAALLGRKMAVELERVDPNLQTGEKRPDTGWYSVKRCLGCAESLSLEDDGRLTWIRVSLTISFAKQGLLGDAHKCCPPGPVYSACLYDVGQAQVTQEKLEDIVVQAESSCLRR